MKKPRVALVCDWLTNMGGAERVILQMVKVFPEAPIFTSFYCPNKMPLFAKADVRASYLNVLPEFLRKHQVFLPLYPRVFESFDLSEFDIVISSSHSCAKGVVTGSRTLHVSYCHSPMRYLWDDCHSYFRDYPMNSLAKFVAPFFFKNLRIWDFASAQRVDNFIANSSLVQKRIAKYFRRESEVIYPSIDVNRWEVSKRVGDYYLALGRLTPYKKFDLLIDVFRERDEKLKIVGTGPELERLKSRASKNIEFLGFVPDEDLNAIYANARALIFPQKEDFGITPLEAMACGRPVIFFRDGGALESIKDKTCGMGFDSQTPEALHSVLNEFESKRFDSSKIRKHAEKFSDEVFCERFRSFVFDSWRAF
jgi:glycosyltransferase involved in cell wall biosynthesis